MDRRIFLKSSATLATVPMHAAYISPAAASSYVTESAGLNDSRRFLDQATMGARPGEADTVKSFTQWLDAQFAQRYIALDHSAAFAAGHRNINGGNRVTAMGVFARWCNEDTQLRFRVAHVLQQIVCCGHPGGNGQLDALLWWNGLMARAFANYKDVLRQSVTHRYMGVFLNNLANDASQGKAPSQNLARELLQLFSMGVHKLNRNGTPVKDTTGTPVAAYQQEDVDALARLLSGWNLPFSNIAAGRDGTLPDGTMQIQRSLAHDGPAVTFLGTTFPRIAAPTANDVIQRMEACLNIIMAQQSTAVYVSRQFIQKMVTDAPSTSYVERVVSVFENNGSGVRGDLKALVRAILLDPEARGNSKPASFGRAQEWVLSLTKAMRYAQMEKLYDTYSTRKNFAYIWTTGQGNPPINILGEMGQVPLTPESVFNDYPFQYDVDGVEAPAAAMWRAPQILANVGRMMSFTPQLAHPLPSGAGDAVGRLQLSWLTARYEAVVAATNGPPAQKQSAAVQALVDRVFADLNQGRTPSATTRAQIIAFIDTDCAQLSTREKLAWLVNFVRCLPEHAVVI